MTYTKTTWADELPDSTPIKYAITDDTDGVIAESATIEMVTPVSIGTPLTATNLNKIETGIEDAHIAAAAAQVTATAAIPKSLVTAVGDLIYATASSVLARLAKPGTTTALLKMSLSGTPSWQDEERFIVPIGGTMITVVNTNPYALLPSTARYGTWSLVTTSPVITGIYIWQRTA